MLLDQDEIRIDTQTGTVEPQSSMEQIRDLVFVIPVHLRAKLLQQYDSLGQAQKMVMQIATVIGMTFELVRCLDSI